jgi:dolichol-phosphate mannosyltransferase
MIDSYNNKKIISICIPVKNESENINLIYETIKKIFLNDLKDYEYEIIFTDNLSTDNSFEIVKNISNNDNKVKGYQFSKNIGKERSLFYAFKNATGAVVIQIDCDFEDPPELLPEFVKKWEEGYEIVHAVRDKRKNDSYSFLRFIFYRLISLISEDNLPNDVGDFRLCDKKVIKKILEIDDQDPYIRGLISSIGYKEHGINHERGKRSKNKSKFGIFNYLGNAINGITNHSIIPLKLATYLGFLVFFICLLLTIFYLFHGLFFESKSPGFTTQTLLILFTIAFNSIFLGIVGEYVGRIYRQIKKNDIFVIKDKTDN